LLESEEKQMEITQGQKVQRAIEYAEKHGIVEFKVNGNRMIYYANYPAYISEPNRTYKVTIRLDTMKEERKLLNKYYPKGNHNLYK
jgi:hypothetical protein